VLPLTGKLSAFLTAWTQSSTLLFSRSAYVGQLQPAPEYGHAWLGHLR